MTVPVFWLGLAFCVMGGFLLQPMAARTVRAVGGFGTVTDLAIKDMIADATKNTFSHAFDIYPGSVDVAPLQSAVSALDDAARDIELDFEATRVTVAELVDKFEHFADLRGDDAARFRPGAQF